MSNESINWEKMSLKQRKASLKNISDAAVNFVKEQARELYSFFSSGADMPIGDTYEPKKEPIAKAEEAPKKSNSAKAEEKPQVKVLDLSNEKNTVQEASFGGVFAVLIGLLVTAITAHSCKKDIDTDPSNVKPPENDTIPDVVVDHNEVINVTVNVNVDMSAITALLADLNLHIENLEDLVQQLLQQNSQIGQILLAINNNITQLGAGQEDIKDLLQRIFAQLLALQQDTNQSHGQQIALLGTIVNLLNGLAHNSSQDHEQIVALLTAIMDGVNHLSEQQAHYFQQILSGIGANNLQNTQIINLLEELVDGQHSTNNLIQQYGDRILQALAALSQQFGAGFSQLYAQLATLINQGQLTNTQLDTIIENMNNMIAHQEQQTTCMYNILNELGMLNQYNEDVKALIEELLVEVQAGHLTLEELLNQMNQLDANVALGFVNVLNAMQNLSPTSHEHLVHLLEQILAKITEGNNNNNANAAEILAALQNLSGQIGNLNTNVQTGIFNILAAIAGLNGGIEELKPILNAILTMINTMDQNQQQAYVDQMEVLTTIMQNQTEGLHFLEIIIGNQNVQINQLTQIITLLNSIKAKCDQINVKFDDVLAILNEIQCDDCCETIIILLQELLNHEGIIDDPFWENPDSNVYGLFHP